MALRLRVQGGTRPDTRLCDSCRYSLIVKGPQQGQEIVFCNRHEKAMNFPVVICSQYVQVGGMTEWEAKEIGWVLEVKNGKHVGFKPPKRFDGEPE